MTLTMLQYLDYLKGRRILTNVEYGFPHEKLNVAEMINDLENGRRDKYQNVSIGLDEFHLFMPSGQISGNQEDKELLINFLYQTRKLEIDVYYVTHRAMNVNHKIRGMVELMLITRKFHKDDGTHCTFDRCKREHLIEVRNANDTQSFMEKEPLYIEPSIVGKLYPTMQLLDITPDKYWKLDTPTNSCVNPNATWKFDEDEDPQEDFDNVPVREKFVPQKTNLELIEEAEKKSKEDLNELQDLIQQFEEAKREENIQKGD